MSRMNKIEDLLHKEIANIIVTRIDNPQIKNMNPSELIMKKNYPKARTQDYNENGVVDDNEKELIIYL